MSDADIVREALGLSRSIVLCNEPWTHTAQTAWENGLEALDGLVARLAETERECDLRNEESAAANRLITELKERGALLEEALRATRDSIQALDLKDALAVIEHTLRGVRGGEQQRT